MKPTPSSPSPQTLEQFVMRMITEGGAIVTSDALSPGEIAVSKAAGRMFVTPEGYGLHLKPKLWLEQQGERILERLAHMAFSPSPVSVEKESQSDKFYPFVARLSALFLDPKLGRLHSDEIVLRVRALLPLGKKDAVSATTVQEKESSGEPGDVAANTVPGQMTLQEESENEARDFASKANICTHSGIYNLALPVFMALEPLEKVMPHPAPFRLLTIFPQSNGVR